MAGLSLNIGPYANGPGQTGGPGTMPYAASVSPGAVSIGQLAFGVQSGVSAGPRLAATGTVFLGLAGAAVLVWLWWTLPR